MSRVDPVLRAVLRATLRRQSLAIGMVLALDRGVARFAGKPAIRATNGRGFMVDTVSYGAIRS
jgi:hypothetical protein